MTTTQQTIQTLINSFAWYDHPEGLKFVETHRDEFRTSGHWLLLPDGISAFHRVLNNEELWLIHQGSIKLHILAPDGTLSSRILGLNLAAGEEPVISVPLGHWQAAELVEDVPFAFGSVICAPAFYFEKFEIGRRKSLLETYPQHGEIISRLAPT